MIEILLLVPLLQGTAGDADLYEAGMQAARAGQWEQARQAFQAGRARFPADRRFATELAGVEYRAGRLEAAQGYLHETLALDPRDAYANEFLGTLYYLSGNIEAALKYWNRIDKPRAGPLQVIPPAPVPAAFLDRAVAFAPGEVLRLDEYRSSLAWIRDLNILGDFRQELAAREGGTFDPMLRWNPTATWMRAALGLGGVPVQSYRYEAQNVGGRAISAAALVRWDAQKRRLFGSVGGPLGDDPTRLYSLYVDARRETWNLGGLDDFRLNKTEAGGRLRFRRSGRFYWETGVVLASRSFQRSPAFASGFTLAHLAGAGFRVADLPEHGFTLDASVEWQTARFLATPGGVFGKGTAELLARWRPRPAGSGYEITARARVGKVVGGAPFDEAFMLGRQRDDGLVLRGLLATRDGKKGRGPIGRQYFLMNFDLFKQVWTPALLAVDLGALADLGLMSQAVAGTTTRRLAVTPGVQVRLRLASGVAVVFSYARDPRGGGGFDAGLR